VNISLLLPTRERPALVHRLFDTLSQTTTDLGNLEVVLYADEDDRASHEISTTAFPLVKLVGRARRTMGSMIRACYDASHGRYVMLINDDVIVRTPGWDTKVIETFGRLPDDIGLIYGNDLDQGEAVPTFPLISRTVCDVLGEICPSGYKNLHIESHLFDIFRQLARLGYGRIRYLENVVFEHMHYVVGKAARDQVYTKKNQRADDLLFIALDDERASKARRLASYIQTRCQEPAARDGDSPVVEGRASTEQETGFRARLRRMLSDR
jgi:hypothetical protein